MKQYKRAIDHTSRILDVWLPLKIRYDKVPGMSVGIVHKGKLIYRAGFGFADLEAKKKATPRTLYRIASISKMFTTVAILQLVEKGKLQLDDPIGKHINWFRGRNKKRDLGKVTIRQVLTHTSGLFRDGTSPHWETGDFPKTLKAKKLPQAAVLETLEHFKYSNYAFSLLGEVIFKVTGRKFEDYIEQQLFKTLRMRESHTDLPRLPNRHLATGYSREIPDRPQRSYEHCKTYAFAPAAGITSNIVDLAQFLSELAMSGRNSPIGRELKKEMMRSYEKTGDNTEYGLGCDIYKVRGRKVIGHSGGFRGFVTDVALDPENDLGVIVLANSEGASASGLTWGILELIYEIADNENVYFNGSKFKGGYYEGIYRERWGDNVIAQVGNALLSFSAETNRPVKEPERLLYEKQHRFRLETKDKFHIIGEPVVFTDIEKGKAQKVWFGPTPATRIV